MKILHTSDWHLGKYLEDYSRIFEQEQFIEELCEICNDKNIDLILISGDIYDTFNPPAVAEKLFYDSLKKLTDNSKRQVVIISGNHDNPERLSAVSSVVSELGIIIVGTLKSKIEVGDYENFNVVDSGEGFIELCINNETVVIITVAYPSEKRIDEFIYTSIDDAQKDYSNKIKLIIDELSKKYREDTINILMGHFYITGGEMEKSERDISLGGSFAVKSDVIPLNAHYVAMGHLHRAQKVANSPIPNAYYSGSPIQYNRSEINNPKCVYIADLKVDEQPVVEKIYLKNYKPIEIWKSDSIEEAIEFCRQNSERNCFVYLEIKTDRVLLQSEIKEIRTLKNDIVEIIPIFESDEETDFYNYDEEKSIEEEFIDFYKSKKKIEPSQELIKIFLEHINEIQSI